MTLGGKLGIYIDYLLGGQIWKTIHEKSQRTLDSVVQLNALGFANAPPTSAHGDTYIVGAAPTGAFAGQAPGAVATYHSTLGGWEFYTPLKGWRGYIASDMYYYNGSAWGLEANLPGASAVAAITAQNVAASVAGAAVANHAASGDHDARYVLQRNLISQNSGALLLADNTSTVLNSLVFPFTGCVLVMAFISITGVSKAAKYAAINIAGTAAQNNPGDANEAQYGAYSSILLSTVCDVTAGQLMQLSLGVYGANTSLGGTTVVVKYL